MLIWSTRLIVVGANFNARPDLAEGKSACR
jgi:hypothetical protein